MSRVTEIVTYIVIMIVMTFLYLMAQIKEGPVPIVVSVIYGISMALEVFSAIKNAIELDIQLDEMKDKENKQK